MHRMGVRSWLRSGAGRHSDQQADMQGSAPVTSATGCGNVPVPMQDPTSSSDACVIRIAPPLAASSPFITQAMAGASRTPAGTTTVAAPGGGSTAALPAPPAAQHGVQDAAAAADASPTSQPDDFDIEAPPQLITSTSIKGLASSSSNSRECRICLSGDNPQDLIQPCTCAGTMRYTHTSCLSSWVQEKGSLLCELCGQHYQEPHAAALAPIVAAARQRKGQTGPAAEGTAGEDEEVEEGRTRWCPATPSQWFCLLVACVLLTCFAVAAGLVISKGQTGGVAPVPPAPRVVPEPSWHMKVVTCRANPYGGYLCSERLERIRPGPGPGP